MNDISQFGPFTTLSAWRDAMRQFLAERPGRSERHIAIGPGFHVCAGGRA